MKALCPFSLWTIDHNLDYIKSKNVSQFEVKTGSISIFLIRVIELR